MSEMIERVARALAYNEGAKMGAHSQCKATREFPWEGDAGHLLKYAERHWKEHEHAACAAIEAMREPTGAMLESGDLKNPQDGWSIECIDTVRDIYTAMIDQALKDTAP